MGLFDDISSVFSGAVSSVLGSSGSYLGGSDFGGPSSSSFLPVTYQPEYPVMSQPVQALPMAAGALAVGSKLAQRFPALWAALSALSQRFGTLISADRLWSMFKQFGPGIAVMIGADALNELMVWRATHKRRRMNVANTKALRRSVRRLKGFDRLSHRVSSQLSRVAHRRGGSRARGRCLTCRKSPCSC